MKTSLLPRNTILIPALSVLAAIALIPTSASADELAVYSFGTDPASVSLAATTKSSLVTASTIWYQNGYLDVARSGANIGESGPNALGLARNVPGAQTMAHSEAQAISSNRWIALQLTPLSGYTMNIESISFYANIDSPTTAANTIAVQARIGDSSNPYVTVASTTITHTGGASGGGFYQMSLSGLTGLTDTTALRLLFFNTDTGTITWSGYTRLDDLTVNGSITPIPESSTISAIIAFGAAAGVAMTLKRRRRARS